MNENLISLSVQEQLKKKDPYHFYLMEPQEYENFIATDIVTKYENTLANDLYNTTLNFSSVEKEKENIEIVIEMTLNNLLFKEKEMYENIQAAFPKKELPKILFPSAKDMLGKNGLSIAMEYQKDFNYFFQSLFLNQKLNQNENKSIDWKAIQPEDTYDFFLFILAQISRQGGFSAIRNGYGIEKSDVFNFYRDIAKQEEKPSLQLMQKSIGQYFDSLSINDKEFKKELKELWRQAAQKKEREAGRNWQYSYFYTIIVPLLLNRINATKGLKTQNYSNIIKRREYWDSFYEELISTNFSLEELTFFSKEGSIMQLALKGDYGEMVQAVLSKHQGIETVYMGSKTANSAQGMRQDQTFTDTLIIVNGKRYGIQDKEFSFLKGKIRSRVYGNSNFILNFKNLELLSYFSTSGVKILGSLLQLYNEDAIDRSRLETLFAHLDMEQLRIIDYRGIGEKEIEQISESDLVYSLIYRITGQYFPASYIFIEREKDIENQSKVFITEQKKYYRTRYKIEDFNLQERNNLLDVRQINNQGNTILKLLDYNTANNIVKLLTLSAIIGQ